MVAALLSPRARRDILEAVGWIARDNRTAAQGLRDAIVRAAEMIGDHPQIGAARPELTDEPVRFLPLTGFPYTVVYDADRDPPLVLRVLHGARDLPSALRSR